MMPMVFCASLAAMGEAVDSGGGQLQPAEELVDRARRGTSEKPRDDHHVNDAEDEPDPAGGEHEEEQEHAPALAENDGGDAGFGDGGAGVAADQSM